MPTCSLRASSAPIAMRPTSVAVLRGVVAGQQAARGLHQILDAALLQRMAQLVGALLQVDPLQVGADAPDHHLAGREQERRHAHDPGHARQPALDVVHLLEVGVAVGLDDEVRVQRQHLVLELALEAARHAEHDDQRRDPQHDAHRRHRREHREHAQQKRHHRHQPAGEDADDARRLDDAVPVLRVREREHHEADRHQRQAGHQPD